MQTAPAFATGKDVLENAEHLVIKIGGENAACFRENFENARRRVSDGQRLLLVLSAFREERSGFNTTSCLYTMAEALTSGDHDTARAHFSQLRSFTERTVRSAVEDDPFFSASKRDSVLDALLSVVDRECAVFEAEIVAADGVCVKLGSDWVLAHDHRFVSVTGFGEMLTQALYRCYFEMNGIASQTLPTAHLASETYRGDPSSLAACPVSHAAALSRLRAMVRYDLSQVSLSECDVVIAPGHFPLLSTERGYSDTGAALVSQAVQDVRGSVVCLIRKQYPLMTGDPRHHASCDVIRHITYDHAAALFREGGGAAGVVHPKGFAMLRERSIPVVICHPSQEWSDETTLIC